MKDILFFIAVSLVSLVIIYLIADSGQKAEMDYHLKVIGKVIEAIVHK